MSGEARKRAVAGAAILLCSALLFVACSAPKDGAERRTGGDTSTDTRVTASTDFLRIAEQHGIAYAPLALMQIERRIDAEWYKMANATVIREAMLAGRLDVGSMGIPPYLIGNDRGTGWEIVAGVSEVPVGLVTRRVDLAAFADLTGSERIALPQPGSIQHILLAIAADRVWGRPDRFDARLLTLSHPDGMTALLAGRDLDVHFTTPPFLFEELAAPDAHLLLDGREAFGGRFTFIVSVASPRLSVEDEDAITRYREVLAAAIDDLSDLQRAVRAGERPSLLVRLAEHYDLDAEELAAQLADEGVVYTLEVHGLGRFESAMRDFGYVE